MGCVGERSIRDGGGRRRLNRDLEIWSSELDRDYDEGCKTICMSEEEIRLFTSSHNRERYRFCLPSLQSLIKQGGKTIGEQCNAMQFLKCILWSKQMKFPFDHSIGHSLHLLPVPLPSSDEI